MTARANSDTHSLMLGTRGSALALAQTEEVRARLHELFPRLQTSVQIVTTHGDRDRGASLAQIGGTGVFARELEAALLAGTIDVAVHSLKDLPPTVDPGLMLAAVPPRADPRDALVSRNALPLAQLPSGVRVGTGSARRRVSLLRARPDLRIVDIRGNVPTRIEKIRHGDVDAVVLAVAGLVRLNLFSQVADVFPLDIMLPAPGQGALAIETRTGDVFVNEIMAQLDDPDSHAAARAERAFLARLGAGCVLPVAAYASLQDGTIDVRGMMTADHGRGLVERRVQGPRDQAAALGEALAADLLAATGS